MIALVTITYIALIAVVYKVLKITPTPKNIAAMVMLGVSLIGSIVIAWQYSAPTTDNVVVSRYTVQLVPQVKGLVAKIHAEPNVPLKKDQDILFEIQKDPYEIAVKQMTASLDSARMNAKQATAGVAAAIAAVNSAEAGLAAAKAQLDVARQTQQLNPDAIAELRVIELQAQYDSAVATVEQSKAAKEVSVLGEKAAQQNIKTAEAQLENAQFNLDQCTVYAPADGFVTNWQVREGAMVVNLPLAPAGTFIDTSRVSLVASFPQNILKNVVAGDSVEFALKSKPGEVLNGEVEAIIAATGEGQFSMTGLLQSASDIGSDGMFAVKFKLDDPEVAESLKLGTAGAAVIYTSKGKPFHAISKVVIRMNAWLYYLIPS